MEFINGKKILFKVDFFHLIIETLFSGESLDLFIFRNKRLNENKIKLFTRQTVGKPKIFIFRKLMNASL